MKKGLAIGAVLIGGVATATVIEYRCLSRGRLLAETSVSAVERLKHRNNNPVLAGALAQLAHPANYDASYIRIPYPNGDVPADRGACTDVIIRALRHAGYDLQKLIHDDMVKRFSSYPRHGDAPDTNIDHRRVPNQIFFFKKFGKDLTLKVDPDSLAQWQPGDIVCWKLMGGLDHTGIVSDRMNGNGVPLVIHNMDMCLEQDVLTSWQIVGHFRYPRVNIRK